MPGQIQTIETTDQGRKFSWRNIAGYFALLLGCVTADAAEPKLTRGKWETAFPVRKAKAKAEIAGIKNLEMLELKGTLKDPFHLSAFTLNGEFGINGGLLARTAGKNAAVELINDVESFELESAIVAEGRGGWFWLLGWKDGHGYALYNVSLKTSGSPWLVGEFRGNEGVPETLQEINRLDWKGQDVLRMSVVDQKLQLQVGTATLAKQIPLPNYHAGAIILGTYDTPYGPRDIGVKQLRYRHVTVAED